MDIARVIGACLAALLAGAGAPQESASLPELQGFLRCVRQNLRSDRSLQSQYTYSERTIIRQLEKSGAVKKLEQRAYEVYPSADRELSYRKLVERDGKRLSASEMEKQDREHDRRAAADARKLERESPSARAAREAKERRKEEAELDEVFRLYEVKMVGREMRDDLPAIRLAFAPKAGYKPQTRDAKMLAKLRGEAWFGESDCQLIRIEARLLDDISLGLGLVAKLNRGAQMIFQRRRVNDEVWLPAEAQFVGRGRILLLRGFDIDVTTEYSEYRKFTVESSVSFPKDRDN